MPRGRSLVGFEPPSPSPGSTRARHVSPLRTATRAGARRSAHEGTRSAHVSRGLTAALSCGNNAPLRRWAGRSGVSSPDSADVERRSSHAASTRADVLQPAPSADHFALTPATSKVCGRPIVRPITAGRNRNRRRPSMRTGGTAGMTLRRPALGFVRHPDCGIRCRRRRVCWTHIRGRRWRILVSSRRTRTSAGCGGDRDVSRPSRFASPPQSDAGGRGT